MRNKRRELSSGFRLIAGSGRPVTSMLLGVVMTLAGAAAHAQGTVQAGTARSPVDPEVVPIRSISLFSSGVGYFERQGSVTGSGSIDLLFDVNDMNDLLKSLIVRDLDGGTIEETNYASQDPLSKALSAFSINLSGNPDVANLLDQARGEEVEVAGPDVVKGTILGVETRTVSDNMQAKFLMLYGASGIRSLNLAEIRSIRFTRASLDSEMQAALALLAQSHNVDKKKVEIRYDGSGTRRIQIGYLRSMPVWKTSYRLVVSDSSLFLQGWAIVENTTDEDWNNVKLNLVAGEPVSFRMNLYTPIYVTRPEVRLNIAQAPVPPAYQQNLGVPQAARSAAKAAPAPSAAASGGGYDQYGLAQAEASPDYGLSQGVQAAALGAQAGAFFEYAVSQPVTIKRRESAMVPIINQNITGQKIAIYDPSVDPVHPMNGVKLTNTTGLHLNAGPITVFEGGTYAGDAQIADITPGQERLVSYSVDLDTEVAPSSSSSPDQIVAVKIDKGTMTITSKLRREVDYTIKYSGSTSRTLLIQQPVSPGWTLMQPAKPDEKTRDSYRFAVKLTPSAGPDAPPTQLAVVEEQTVSNQIALSSTSLDTISVYIRSTSVSPAIKAALQHVADLRTQLSAIQAQISETNRSLQQIYSDQTRIRNNMGSLDKSSQLYNRYVSTLNDQEDQIAKLKDDLSKYSSQETAKRQEIDRYLSSLTLD